MSPDGPGAATTVSDVLGLPLEDFTAARDRLAKDLRKAGDRDVAAAVAALRKPGVHLWAVNQLARRREVAVKRLLSNAADLAAAQQAVLSGAAGAGDRLRRDSSEYQRALDQAVRETRELLRDATRGAGEETLRRVREVLANAALGLDDRRDELARGSLTDEPEAPGFGLLAAGPGPLPRPEPERAARGAQERAGRAAEAAAGEAARQRKVDLRRELERAEGELRRAQQAAHRLRRRAEATAAEARTAAGEADRAEAVLEAAAVTVNEARERLR